MEAPFLQGIIWEKWGVMDTSYSLDSNCMQEENFL